MIQDIINCLLFLMALTMMFTYCMDRLDKDAVNEQSSNTCQFEKGIDK
jgi:hypothetical protein